ncbi:MAG TPA: hypothetical protein VEX86_14580 [Longimicrobium sp.]|nr:hypothetical protein [Longimicrobium sp.]
MVVDNAPAARIVERVLADPRVEVVNAKERSTAMMKARSILLRELEPTVLLLDADSLEERAIVEDRLEIGGYLQRSSRGIPNRLVLAVPQVEGILFTDRRGLEKALGRRIGDEDFFEARFRPKAVLYRLLDGEDAEGRALRLIEALDASALKRMASHPAIREIQEFVSEVAVRFRRVG